MVQFTPVLCDSLSGVWRYLHHTCYINGAIWRNWGLFSPPHMWILFARSRMLWSTVVGKMFLGPQVVLLGDRRAAREGRFSPERSTTVILNVCLSQEGDPVWSVSHHRPVYKSLLPAGSRETRASSADFLCSFSASGFSGQSLHPVLLCFCPINLDAWKLIFSKFKILLCVGESLLLIHITQINHFSLWYKYFLMNIIFLSFFTYTFYFWSLTTKEPSNKDIYVCFYSQM